MKYDPIDPALFIKNRERLVKDLKPRSIAVFNSNDSMPTNADSIHSFVQNTDLFYLTGIDQEESILILCPEAPDHLLCEILFIRETSEEIAIWEGHKHTREQATEISGIKTVYWLREFERIFKQLVFDCDHIYLNSNEHSRADTTVETRDRRFLKWCKDIYPLHEYKRLAPIMHKLRIVKSPLEIELIRHACKITEKTFRRLLRFIRPGVWEYEVEAEICHEFLKNRAEGPAYASIVASGMNACILHYIKNDRRCEKGELVLMDFGAIYAHYTSDVTRTVPISGKFSKRQKEVYASVLRIHDTAVQLMKPGNTLDHNSKQMTPFIEEELVGLKLFSRKALRNQTKDSPLFKKYFMHGISHYLGLDVHDYGDKYQKLEPGMIVTCEPGIYIKEESIGIRLENDILITPNGPENLTHQIPIDAGEIEELMNS